MWNDDDRTGVIHPGCPSPLPPVARAGASETGRTGAQRLPALDPVKLPMNRYVARSGWWSETLDAPDCHHLYAAEGWLELGNSAEANAALELISPENRVHPEVLELHWRIYRRDGAWDACRDVSTILTELAPRQPLSWVLHAQGFHRAGRTREAYEVLRSMAGWFPDDYAVTYDLACYAAALGRHREALNWLDKAIALSEFQVPSLSSLRGVYFREIWDTIRCGR